ncbi:hypothetical protein DM02DRAFT_635209 [Periconia macrospinosa]|uniref:CARDB domain-containing protein n=1 Tax=Periconia macrospinosa TaxID=97972 RepID=A0A2V1D3K6_9PLEO|nr:hypothetical protein DM02DRAFT_635209 [Periconia macrospinosa]
MAIMRFLSMVIFFLGLIRSSLAHPKLGLARRQQEKCVWLENKEHNCHQVYLDHQRTFYLSDVKVYTLDDFPIPADSNYIYQLTEALDDVMGLYDLFLAGKPTRISLYIVPHKPLGNQGALSIVGDDNSSREPYDHCTIMLSTNATDGHGWSDHEFKHMVAHELYHCVQFRYHPTEVNTSPTQYQNRLWWSEGTSEFFANFFYPMPSDAQYFNKIYQYNPATPIYQTLEKKTGEPPSLYFMYLYDTGISEHSINSFMAKQYLTDSLEEERSRVATSEDLSDWSGFATAFIDNTIDMDRGSPIVAKNPAQVHAMTDAPLTDDFEIELIINPFTINPYSVTFDGRASVGVTFETREPEDDKFIVQYRRAGTVGSWITVDIGETLNIQTPGSNKECGPNREYIFVATSTADPAENELSNDEMNHATLSFTVTIPEEKRQAPTATCSTSSATPTPTGSLDTCLIGNWNLDLPVMESLITKKLQELSVNPSNVHVTGTSTLSITSAFLSTMAFSALNIVYDYTAGGFATHTTMAIDGSLSGTIVGTQAPSGSSAGFAWANDYKNAGTVHTVTEVFGLTLPLDFPLTGQYNVSMIVEYACQGNALSMTGYYNGKYVWVHSWTRA